MNTLERFKKAVEGSRYPGVILDAGGEPLVATDGHVLLCNRPSIITLHNDLVGAVAPGDLSTPTVRQIDTLISDAIKLKNSRSTPVMVNTSTQPTESLVKANEQSLKVTVLTLEETIRKESAQLQKLIDAKRKDGSIASCREKIAAEKASLREANSRKTPGFHGLLISGAAFDVRLIQKALKGLGVKEGSISVAGPYDAAVLGTVNGCALVMPFRA